MSLCHGEAEGGSVSRGCLYWYVSGSQIVFHLGEFISDTVWREGLAFASQCSWPVLTSDRPFRQEHRRRDWCWVQPR